MTAQQGSNTNLWWPGRLLLASLILATVDAGFTTYGHVPALWATALFAVAMAGVIVAGVALVVRWSRIRREHR